jgi:hypothetical protein
MRPRFIVICRYPADRVSLYTSFKSRQGVGCAFTRCHVPCSSGPLLPIEVSTGTSTCPAAPDLAFLPRGVRCCHVSCGPGPRLLAELKSFGATTYPTAPSRLWTTGIKNDLSLRHATGLACFQSTLACYRGACKTCGQAVIVRFNSATPAQLTTPGHGYSGNTTQQDGTTALAMFSTAG